MHHYHSPTNRRSCTSYDDVNIEMKRLNSIDFKKSWSFGLKNSWDTSEEMRVQKSAANFDMVNSLWRRNYLKDRGLIFKEEIYRSNWFPLAELPPSLLFHHFDRAVPKELDVRQLPYLSRELLAKSREKDNNWIFTHIFG